MNQPGTIIEQPDRWLDRPAWLVAIAALSLLAFAAVRLWCVDGLVRRVSIDGPSMAPALCGQCHWVACGDCSFSFRCDAEHVPADGRAACPNCGFINNRLSAALLVPAETVLIDRWPLWWRMPRKGDVVACRAPGGELAVKRIAALPFERLAIQEGDVHDGQRLIRKSSRELRAVRLLVHDNNYQPRKTPSLPPRWRGGAASTPWRADGTAFRVDNWPNASENYDWLEYEHWPGTPNERLRTTPSPITDNDSFNQGETRRPLNVVSDVLLSCRIRAAGTGRFALAAVDGVERFEMEVEPGKQASLRSGGRTLITRPLPTTFSLRSVQIEFGLCDRQVLFSVEGRVVLRHSYERAEGPRPDVLRPLAIGASGIDLHVERLRVWRDMHYLDPDGLSRPWVSSSTLAGNEFGLLGDNQPVSIDSRQWEPPGVSQSAIVGLVYKPFWNPSK